MCRYTFVLGLLFCLMVSTRQWVLEGPTSDIPIPSFRSAHEAKLLQQRLLHAFRRIDPKVADATIERIHRYYRSI
ncbi:hypothetical protein RB195_000302 [Necator americanus]|uniref:Uncharacterized protein n=2 Tax=Necator americanus TaxID=51031 RepID=A0ABR1DAN7_NECAM|nr:hypothetical protein NECAME_15832 [Necator americanus]ETN68409.1 hypothetical protein NECAME_15832 [Necator americanus]